MTERQLDVLFINANSSSEAYQSLANDYAAIEPPTWALLLANSCRSQGYGVALLDADAERLTDEEAVKRIEDMRPRLIVFVAYGQNPNSGTTSMTGVIRLAKQIRQRRFGRIGVIGTHVSGLPQETLQYDCFDFVFYGDGVYALWNLLATDLVNDLGWVKGIGWKNCWNFAHMNQPAELVPTERMDVDLPGMAYDLIDDWSVYRTHFWHNNYKQTNRSPYVALYTSLGCKFTCSYCCINAINKNSSDDAHDAAMFNNMRFWSPEFIRTEFEKIAKLGIEHVRISDEMFLLNRKYYLPILEIMRDQFDFNSWVYGRIDSTNPKSLSLLKEAGVNYIGMGIEAANRQIRREISKGKFEEVDIKSITTQVRDEGINVGANYIFGFENEKLEDLQQTLDLALELNTEFANFYCATPLPPSPMYYEAKKRGWAMPERFEEYAFLGYSYVSLPTIHMSREDVLRFRDNAWHTYFENPSYLSMMEAKFGLEVRQNIEKQSKIRLKRKLLGD